MNRSIFTLLLGLLLSGCGIGHKKISDVTLIEAYEVITDGVMEPSGLTWWDGEFYAVSDKHNSIYRLIFDGKTVRFKPVITIDSQGEGKFDFEGISHDDYFFYLASERYDQVIKVSKDGQQVVYLSKNDHLANQAKAAGLFALNNAHLEGICVNKEGALLLVAERQPRGFITANVQDNQLLVSGAYTSETSYYPAVKDRSPDFSGLSCADGIYVLERNANTVTHYGMYNGRLTQQRSWRFDHVINRPEHRYQDMTFGHAEGLVVKGDEIYVILDNNKSPHEDGSNNHSILLKLRK